MVKKEYGWWICPVCGDECIDPNTTHSTVCHNGHSVYLGCIKEDGRREAMRVGNGVK